MAEGLAAADQSGTVGDGSGQDLSFPRQNARTGAYGRGVPRRLTVIADGSRVLFLRSTNGTDAVSGLWSLDVASGKEECIADPRTLLADTVEDLSPAERARRERLRETGSGIVAFSLDGPGTVAAFSLSSRLWLADLLSGEVRELPATGPVIDPRPDPTGTWVAYAGAGALHVVRTDGSESRTLAEPDHDDITWGLAEFVASEEMDRDRGYWWSPDGASLLAARVDESPVTRWHISDPAHPDSPPQTVAYPAAGTNDADVTLHVVDLTGERTAVQWDRSDFPYLITASWTSSGPPLAQVMSRSQQDSLVLSVDAGTGATTDVLRLHDDSWLDVMGGMPAWLPDGRLLHSVDRDDVRRVALGDDVVDLGSAQLDHVIDIDATGVLIAASENPTELHLWRVALDGSAQQLTEAGGVHVGTAAGGTLARVRRTLGSAVVEIAVVRDGAVVTTVESLAETPVLRSDPRLLTVGEDGLRIGIVLPRDHTPGRPLPVLMNPYGGPHHREVMATQTRWLTSQWLADQGFAVVVADGRGTGGRGPAWDRAMFRDLGDIALEDQVRALHGAAEHEPDLDLSRVAIRGWSFGGYLAAMAVMRRPDVFHAAVAGAPVTDLRLYDTFYTERYLGHPDHEPEVYRRNSLIDDAAALRRPLLLIHGLADDNVVAAHTLRLSSALLAAGRPHDVLPLSGVTHMTPQEEVAENLLLLQVNWLRRALSLQV